MAGKAYTMKEMKEIVQYLVEQEAYKEVKGRYMWDTFAKSGRTKRTWQGLKEVFLKRIMPDISNPYYQLTPGQISSFRCGYDVNKRTLNRLDWVSGDSSIEQDGKKKESTHQLSVKVDNAQQAGPSGLAGESKNSQITIKSPSKSSNLKNRPHSSSKSLDKMHERSPELLEKKRKTLTIESSDDIIIPSSYTKIYTLSSGSDESDIDERNEREVLKIKREIEENLCIVDSQETIILDTLEIEAGSNKGISVVTTTKGAASAKETDLQNFSDECLETRDRRKGSSVEQSKHSCNIDLTDDIENSQKILDGRCRTTVSPRGSDLGIPNVCDLTRDNCMNDSEGTLILIDASDDEVIELSSNDERDYILSNEDIDSFIKNVDVVKGNIMPGFQNKSKEVCNIDETDSLKNNLETGVSKLNEIDSSDIGNDNNVSTSFSCLKPSSSEPLINVNAEKEICSNENLEYSTNLSVDESIVEKCAVTKKPIQVSTESNYEDLVNESMECGHITEQNPSDSKVSRDKTLREFLNDDIENCVESVIYLDCSETSNESLQSQNHNNYKEKIEQDNMNMTICDRKKRNEITINDVTVSQMNEENTQESGSKNLSQSLVNKTPENECGRSNNKAVDGNANKKGERGTDDSGIVYILAQKNDEQQTFDLKQIRISDCTSIETEQISIQDTEILSEIQAETCNTASAGTAISEISQCDKTSNLCHSTTTDLESISQGIEKNTITSSNVTLETPISAKKINETQSLSNEDKQISMKKYDAEIMIICDRNETRHESNGIDVEMHLDEMIELGSLSKKSSSYNDTVVGKSSTICDDNLDMNNVNIEHSGLQIASNQICQSCPASPQSSNLVTDKEVTSTVCDTITNITLDKMQETYSSSNTFFSKEKVSVACDDNEAIGSLGTEIPLNILREIWSRPNPTSKASSSKEITEAFVDDNDGNIEHLDPHIPETNKNRSHPHEILTLVSDTDTFNDNDSIMESKKKPPNGIGETVLPSLQILQRVSDKETKLPISDVIDTNIESLVPQKAQNAIHESCSSNIFLKDSANRAKGHCDDDDANINSWDTQIPPNKNQINHSSSHLSSDSQIKSTLCDENDANIGSLKRQIPTNCIQKSFSASNQILQASSGKEIISDVADYNYVNMESFNPQMPMNEISGSSPSHENNIEQLDSRISPNQKKEHPSLAEKTIKNSTYKGLTSPICDDDNITDDFGTLDTQIPPNKVVSQSSSHQTQPDDNSFMNIEQLELQTPPHQMNVSHSMANKTMKKTKYKGITSSICDDNITLDVVTLDTQIPPNKVVSQSSSHQTQSNDSHRNSTSISGDKSSISVHYKEMSKSPTQVKKCDENKTRTTEMKDRQNKSKDMSKMFGFSKGSGKPKVSSSKNQTDKPRDTEADVTIDITINDPKDNETREELDSSPRKTLGHHSSYTDASLESTFDPGNIKRNSEGNLMIVYGSKLYPLVAKVGGDMKHLKWLPEGTEYTSINLKESEKQEGCIPLREGHHNRSQRIDRRSRSISGNRHHTETCSYRRSYKQSNRMQNNDNDSGDSSDASPIRARGFPERLSNKNRKRRHDSYERMSTDTYNINGSKSSTECQNMALRFSTDKESVGSSKCFIKPNQNNRRDSLVCDLPLKRRRGSYDLHGMHSKKQNPTDLESLNGFSVSRDVNWQRQYMESHDINVKLMDIIAKLMRDKTNSLEDLTRDTRDNSPVFEVKSRKWTSASKSNVTEEPPMVEEMESDVVVIDDEDKCSNSSKVTVQLPAKSAHNIMKLANILQDTGVDKLEKILAAIAANGDVESDTAIKRSVDQREHKIFQEIEAMETGPMDAGSSPRPSPSIQEAFSIDTQKITEKSPRNNKSKTKIPNDSLLEPEVAETVVQGIEENIMKVAKGKKSPRKVKSVHQMPDENETTVTVTESQSEGKVTQNKKKTRKEPPKPKVVDETKTLLAVPKPKNAPATSAKKSPQKSSPTSAQGESSTAGKEGGRTKKAKSTNKKNKEEEVLERLHVTESDEEIVFAKSLDKSSSKAPSSEEISQDLLAGAAMYSDTKKTSRHRREKLPVLASSSIIAQSEEMESDSSHDVRYMLPEMAKNFEQAERSQLSLQKSARTSKPNSNDNSKVTKRREKANKRATSMDNFRAFTSSPETTNDYIDSDDTNISSENRIVKRRRKSERPNRHFRSSSTPRRQVQICPDFIRRRRRTLTDYLKIKHIGSENLVCSSEKPPLVIQKSRPFTTSSLESYKSNMFETVDKKKNKEMSVFDHSPLVVIDNRSQTIRWTTVSLCENSQSTESVEDNNTKIFLDNILQNSLSPIAATSKSFERSREIVGEVSKRLSSSPIIHMGPPINSTELSGELESQTYTGTIIEVPNESTFLGKLAKNMNGDLTTGGVSGIACLPDTSNDITSSKTKDKSIRSKPQKRPRSKSSTNVTPNYSGDSTSECTEKSSITIPGRITRSKSANNVKETNAANKSLPQSLYKGITDLSLEKITVKSKVTSKKRPVDISDFSLRLDSMSSYILPMAKTDEEELGATNANKKNTIKVKILKPNKKHREINISETTECQSSTIDCGTPKIVLNSSGLNSKFQGLTFDSVLHEPMSVKFDSICQDDTNLASRIEVPQVHRIETITLDQFQGEQIQDGTCSDMEIGSEIHVKKESDSANSTLITLDLSNSRETLEPDSRETLEFDSSSNDTINLKDNYEYSSEIDFITPINTNFSDIVERRYNKEGCWYLLSEEESQSSPPRLERPVVQPVPVPLNYPYIHAKSIFTDLSIINEDSKEASRDATLPKIFTRDINSNTYADDNEMSNIRSIMGKSDLSRNVQVLDEPKLSEEEIFLTCPNSPIVSQQEQTKNYLKNFV